MSRAKPTTTPVYNGHCPIRITSDQCQCQPCVKKAEAPEPEPALFHSCRLTCWGTCELSLWITLLWSRNFRWLLAGWSVSEEAGPLNSQICLLRLDVLGVPSKEDVMHAETQNLIKSFLFYVEQWVTGSNNKQVWVWWVCGAAGSRKHSESEAQSAIHFHWL